MSRSETHRKFYDELYASHADVYGFPSAEVAQIPEFLASGTVTELGAGQGRNALALARKGFQVRAVDFSSVGLQDLSHEAQIQGLNIETAQMDVRNIQLRESDAFVAVYLLHHLPRPEALALIAQMKAQTKLGGINVLTEFTQKGDIGAAACCDRRIDSDTSTRRI